MSRDLPQLAEFPEGDSEIEEGRLKGVEPGVADWTRIGLLMGNLIAGAVYGPSGHWRDRPGDTPDGKRRL